MSMTAIQIVEAMWMLMLQKSIRVRVFVVKAGLLQP